MQCAVVPRVPVGVIAMQCAVVPRVPVGVIAIRTRARGSEILVERLLAFHLDLLLVLSPFRSVDYTELRTYSQV